MADCEAADFCSSRNVRLDERGRCAQCSRDVVETVARIIDWKQRGWIGIESQQVVNCIRIFPAIQTMRAWRGEGRSGGLCRVEPSLKRAREKIICCLVRAVHAGRRHHTRAQFSYNFFADLGMFAD